MVIKDLSVRWYAIRFAFAGLAVRLTKQVSVIQLEISMVGLDKKIIIFSYAVICIEKWIME